MNINSLMIDQLKRLEAIAARNRARGQVKQAEYIEGFIQELRAEFELPADEERVLQPIEKVVELTSKLAEAQKVDPAGARTIEHVLDGTLNSLDQSASELLEEHEGELTPA